MARPLSVLLVGNYREDAQHSMLGFGSALQAGLPIHGVDVEFIAPQRILRSPTRKLDKWFAYGDKYVLFPRRLRNAARRHDVVHILDQGNGIYLRHLRRFPHMVTCHDLLAIRSALGELPYWATGRTGALYQRAILGGLRRAHYVACVSSATLRDARRLLELPDSNFGLIYNGLFRNWSPKRGEAATDRCAAAGLTAGSPFLLHVGNASPYKNRAGAIEVYARWKSTGGPSALVLAGKPLSTDERRLVRERGLEASVVKLSSPSPDDIEWLYGNAVALIVASHDEGFGMPILEAQACDCLVCVPDKEPMSEVAGGAAVLIDPCDPTAAATTISLQIPNAERWRKAGRKNAENYSGPKMIAAYHEAYGSLRGEAVN